MDTYRAQVVGEWLLALRGSATQDVFLADLKRKIGWAPHRPNLSKYENGRAIPEPETLARFVAYGAKRGIAGPDFSPRVAPVDPVVAAMDRQTAAIKALVGELREWRTADRDRLGAVERTAELLAARLLPVSGAEGSPARRAHRESAE